MMSSLLIPNISRRVASRYGASSSVIATSMLSCSSTWTCRRTSRQISSRSSIAASLGGVGGRGLKERIVMHNRAMLGGGATGRRNLFVKVDSTPNPDSMKFVPEGRVVLPEEFGTGKQFSTMEDAKGSKLVRRLLKLEQITGVFLGREFISVNKKEEASWTPLKPIVLDAIMDSFNELDTKGTPIILHVEASKDTLVQEEDTEVVAMIKELLETRIRPAVQEDGGDIFYEGFDDVTGIVKLRMAGSCVGCPSSTATLRGGVENMLMHYIPEVRGIQQVEGEVIEKGKAELEEFEKKLGAGEEKEAKSV